MRTKKIGVLLLALAGICAASHRREQRRASQTPGEFDFYLLVLSWSPEFCYSHPGAAECSARKGFVVHGLWPQNNDGSYPQNCETNQRAPSNPEEIADFMPREIIRHEWRAHGTCSGLSGDDYFGLVRRISDSIRIPERLKQPRESSTMSTAQLKHEFERANPELRDNGMAVRLRGNYLDAVEFCESNGANPRPISCSGIRDTRQGTFVIQPTR